MKELFKETNSIWTKEDFIYSYSVHFCTKENGEFVLFYAINFLSLRLECFNIDLNMHGNIAGDADYLGSIWTKVVNAEKIEDIKNIFRVLRENGQKFDFSGYNYRNRY